MSSTSLMKEAIEALYPPRPAASRRRLRRSGSSSSHGGSFQENSLPPQFRHDVTTTASVGSLSSISPSKRKVKKRFSELLLEHGERDLHLDFAVCASSSILSSASSNGSGISGSCQMKKIEGRLRVCSQSIIFEPRQASRGIVRIAFRHMTVCPFLGGGSNSSTTDLNVLSP